MDDPYYPVGPPPTSPMPTSPPQVPVPDPMPQEPYGTGSEDNQNPGP